MSRQRQRVERWVYKPRKVRRSARSQNRQEGFSPTQDFGGRVALPASCFQISGFKSCERTTLCCLSRHVCGSLLRKPVEKYGGSVGVGDGEGLRRKTEGWVGISNRNPLSLPSQQIDFQDQPRAEYDFRMREKTVEQLNTTQMVRQTLLSTNTLSPLLRLSDRTAPVKSQLATWPPSDRLHFPHFFPARCVHMTGFLPILGQRK